MILIEKSAFTHWKLNLNPEIVWKFIKHFFIIIIPSYFIITVTVFSQLRLCIQIFSNIHRYVAIYTEFWAEHQYLGEG